MKMNLHDILQKYGFKNSLINRCTVAHHLECQEKTSVACVSIHGLHKTLSAAKIEPVSKADVFQVSTMSTAPSFREQRMDDLQDILFALSYACYFKTSCTELICPSLRHLSYSTCDTRRIILDVRRPKRSPSWG